VSAAARLEQCLAGGGVAVFPSDTVYGLACDPLNRTAVERLYRLKGRPLQKASAVMFFRLELALAALPEIGPTTRDAIGRLLPGAVTALVPNPGHRFPLACGDEPKSLGLRVPVVKRLSAVSRPMLQSSANLAGGPDPRRLKDVPQEIRSAVDLELDGGELPGTSSTVVDLRRYEADGSWSVVRPGAVGEEKLRAELGAQFHFRPASYLKEIRAEVPEYDRLQDELVAASGMGARRILELGTGTGETASRLLAQHPEATLVGIDESAGMLAAARTALPDNRVELRVGMLEDELPEGPFDLVASALCVHHLDGAQKAQLFARIREALTPGGRFALADVITPEDERDARIPLTAGYDKPSPVRDQLQWLGEAGFAARVVWESGDLAVIVGEKAGS
jgi:tRNA threonylcarbamoyl adenosine modification protein (Sua5/YciO/YrdC/YwlC family)